MADDNGDRTESASPRKRADARRKGMFAYSQDLNNAVILMVSLWALTAAGAWLFDSQLRLMQGWLEMLNGRRSVNDILTRDGVAAVLPAFMAALAVIGTIAAATLVAGVFQAGLHFEVDLLELKWERLDPISGLKRVFSLTALVTALLGLLKLIVVSWAAFQILSTLITAAPGWWQVPLQGLVPLCSELTLKLGWSVAVPMLFLGAVDYGYKYWKHERDLMMTKQEVRDENKQQDGDPFIKQRIRQIQRQRAMRRMMQDVPKATVVITNPTHVAVALRYEAGVAGAPVVIAKGEHIIAQRIKALAASHGIPVIEEPPLARALLRSVQVGQEISLEFYRAVAEILATLYRRNSGVPRTAGAKEPNKTNVQVEEPAITSAASDILAEKLDAESVSTDVDSVETEPRADSNELQPAAEPPADEQIEEEKE